MDFDNNQNGYAPLKPNNGKLFKNKDKVTGDNKPDYSGPWCDERGDEAQIAMYLHKSKKGETYMKVRVTEKWTPTQAQVSQQAPTPPSMPDDFEQTATSSLEDDFLGDNGRF